MGGAMEEDESVVVVDDASNAMVGCFGCGSWRAALNQVRRRWNNKTARVVGTDGASAVVERNHRNDALFVVESAQHQLQAEATAVATINITTRRKTIVQLLRCLMWLIAFFCGIFVISL
jgi:hypothetical protein